MIPAIHAKRVLFFFNDQRQEWSESYWQSETTSLEDAMRRAQNLAITRVQSLAQGVRLSEIRVSDDAVLRDSIVDTGFDNWAIPAGANPESRIYNLALIGDCIADNDASNPDYIIRLRQEGDPPDGPNHRHRRVTFFSGYPKCNQIDQGNLPPFKGKAFGIAFNRFLTVLTNPDAGWGFTVFKNPPEVGPTNILNITRDPLSGIVTVTHDNAVNFPVGRTVEIYRPKFFGGSLKIQGKYDVRTSVPGQFTVVDQFPGVVQYQGGGTVSLVSKQWVQIVNAQADGFSIRKRGVVENAPRGRSRSRHRYAG